MVVLDHMQPGTEQFKALDEEQQTEVVILLNAMIDANTHNPHAPGWQGGGWSRAARAPARASACE